uniref:Uncharacterized protein n=1 Tax=Brassica oleracea var. oleracea TaxID=109376 RepID=A0A0D3ANJ0_BRAOL
KKIDFVNKEFSTSQSVKLPPPAKNPQGDLEKVPKKRRLSSQIQVEEKNDEIRLWDPVEALQEEEPRPSLNAHIQNIQLMLLKIGDHKVAFQAREENRVADKIAKEDLF